MISGVVTADALRVAAYLVFLANPSVTLYPSMERDKDRTELWCGT